MAQPFLEKNLQLLELIGVEAGGGGGHGTARSTQDWHFTAAQG
jgi:hypothetical protein